jgi:hypothetical protein
MEATKTKHTQAYVNWCLEQVVGSEWHNVEIILQAYRFINNIGKHEAWGLLQDEFEGTLWNTGNFVGPEPPEFPSMDDPEYARALYACAISLFIKQEGNSDERKSGI